MPDRNHCPRPFTILSDCAHINKLAKAGQAMPEAAIVTIYVSDYYGYVYA